MFGWFGRRKPGPPPILDWSSLPRTAIRHRMHCIADRKLEGTQLERTQAMFLYLVAFPVVPPTKTPSDDLLSAFVESAVASADFGGDNTMLEAAVFWLFLIDLWFRKHPVPGDPRVVSNAMADVLVESYQSEIPASYVNRLINDRLAIYAKPINESSDFAAAHRVLARFIEATRGNTLPRFANERINVLQPVGATEAFLVFASVRNHYMAFMPMMENLFSQHR